MNSKVVSFNKHFFRIFEVKEDSAFVIDCNRKTMPQWVSLNSLVNYVETDENEMLMALGSNIPGLDSLSKAHIKEAYSRYASISNILPSIKDYGERKIEINKASIFYKVSKQTIRHRLCDYLVFQSVAALSPKPMKAKELTDDEKNFRWALNKYFYKSNKISLSQAYKRLIRAKYLDDEGKIVQNSPKFHQFKYFYYKHRNESNYIISRLGRGEYDRNYRPLLGEGVREKFTTIGYGMLDSTICDIYLVNEEGKLIGRPVLTACIDAYSGMCLGYSLGWEGGIKSLRKLMLNVISDKVELCKKFGINITQEEWNCSMIPHKLITDMGTEYAGETFSQLTDLGIEIINLKPYRPEMKSVVERFFGLIQDSFKDELINNGVVLKDFGDRGATDYRKNACLTLDQFEKVILLCVIHYNCGRIIELPYGCSGIKSHSKDLWNYLLEDNKNNFISVTKKELELVLLPRCTACFKRSGLLVNNLRYKAVGFTNDYLKGGAVQVAYDPFNVTHVWLIKNDEYIEFELINKHFEGMNLDETKQLVSKRTKPDVANEELESGILLSKELELIRDCCVKRKVNIKGIRKNRSEEVKKNI